MRPRCFEFISNQTESEKPCAEGILLVAALRSGVGRTFLNQRLMTDGEAELDVALDLACMKCGIEQPELDCAFGEDAVEIERMVPRRVVVLIPSAVTVVPHSFKLIHIHRTLRIQLIEESGVRFLTVSLSVHIYLQGFIQQIFLRRHDVDDVAERFHIVGRCIHMNMNPAGIVDFRAACTERPDDFLYGFDVGVYTDRRNEFNSVVLIGSGITPGFRTD